MNMQKGGHLGFFCGFIYLYILYTSHFTPAPDNMKRAKCLSLRRVEILGESTHWGLRKEVRANIYAKSRVRERHLNIFVAPEFHPCQRSKKSRPRWARLLKNRPGASSQTCVILEAPLIRKWNTFSLGWLQK